MASLTLATMDLGRDALPQRCRRSAANSLEAVPVRPPATIAGELGHWLPTPGLSNAPRPTGHGTRHNAFQSTPRLASHQRQAGLLGHEADAPQSEPVCRNTITAIPATQPDAENRAPRQDSVPFPPNGACGRCAHRPRTPSRVSDYDTMPLCQELPRRPGRTRTGWAL